MPIHTLQVVETSSLTEIPSRGAMILVRRCKVLKRTTCCVGRRPCSSFGFHGRYKNAQEEEEEGGLPTAEWYRAAYPKLIKLACALRNVDQVDGRITNTDDGSTISDDRVIAEMQMFKWLARAFVGSPSMQHPMSKAAASASPWSASASYREPMTLNSLTTVCNFLNVSAQQRKSVRLTVCPQVTQHHIWRAALEEVLKNVGSELQTLSVRSPAIRMGEQIVSSCVQFLADTTGPSEQDTPLWMQLAPEKKPDKPLQPRKWAEVLEMFEDLSKCLAKEEKLAGALCKVEVMKEGLYQIKDLLVEREIGYKEVRRQDCLVQKLLSKNLGHSSKCLFTLLLYYLYGSVRDPEVDACWFCARDQHAGGGGGSSHLNAGKILTYNDERMVWSGLKQLDRALGVFKFVWETAGMKGVLELRGHIWCVGAEERSLMHRGNKFFVHDFRV